MQVTKEGLVFGPSGKQLKPFIFRGYERVSVRIDGKWKNPFVHRLVAEKFLGKSNLPINHKDCNKRNNNVSNLEYVTPQQNQTHAANNALMARGERNGNSKLCRITVGEIRRLKEEVPELTQREIAENFNVSQSLVSQILKKQVWAWLTVLMIFMPSYSSAEQAAKQASEIVLQTISMEAANQGEYGQYLVASVIVNRVRFIMQNDPEATMEEYLPLVCLAPKQFSCHNSPSWKKAWLDRHYGVKTREKAISALNKAIVSGVVGINHYHTKAILPYWAKGKRPVVVYKDYLFYDLE